MHKLTFGSVSSDSYADLQKHYPDDSWDETGNNAYGCVKQLYLLKQQNRNLKVLLSIGGWTYSPSFAAPLATDSGRSNFVNSAVSFVQDWGLDGIDIDYEYPADAGAASDFTQLLSELRTALDAYTAKNGGNKQLISVAMPAGPTHYEVLDLKGMDASVDLFNIMNYDYTGSFANYTGHQANLYPSKSNPNATPFNSAQAIDYFLSQGIASQKITMWVPE
jgi:chitinase